MEQPLVLFDGMCNLCSGAVRFTIKHDHQARLKFTPLQSEHAAALLKNSLAQPSDSFLLLKNNRIYNKSTAALKLLPFFRWYWQWMRLGWLLPRKWRDALYDLIAKNRYKWFGKKEQCMMPTAELKKRFL